MERSREHWILNTAPLEVSQTASKLWVRRWALGSFFIWVKAKDVKLRIWRSREINKHIFIRTLNCHDFQFPVFCLFSRNVLLSQPYLWWKFGVIIHLQSSWWKAISERAWAEAINIVLLDKKKHQELAVNYSAIGRGCLVHPCSSAKLYISSIITG